MEILTDRITNRYNTMITNIKSMSNSYYDSYLDLLEETLVYILDEELIEFDHSKTCGNIVRMLKVYNFLLLIGLSKETVDKLPDYIKKCNDHKHKKEKSLNIDSVIKYLSVYFNFVNGYLKYKGEKQLLFDKEYYISIFGETLRKNEALNKEVETLKLELSNINIGKEKYSNIINSIEGFKGNLEESNGYLLEQINELKNIKMEILEEKLNKTLDMLLSMKDYLTENRILQKRTLQMINGEEITDEMLIEARKRK